MLPAQGRRRRRGRPDRRRQEGGRRERGGRATLDHRDRGAEAQAVEGVRAVFDLSATPFFLRGSGYREGSLFPWTVSDFQPDGRDRVRHRQAAACSRRRQLGAADTVIYRDLGITSAKTCRRPAGQVPPSSIRFDLPTQLQTALYALYSHYEETFEGWAARRHRRPARLHRGVQQHRDLQAGLSSGSPASSATSEDGQRAAFHAGHLEAVPQLRRTRRPPGAPATRC